MTAAVRLDKLHYRYGREQVALHEISLTIEAGECVGLIGPNGAGKSTLLMHLNGFLPETLPLTPAIFIDGEPLCTATLPKIRRHVGVMFQDPDDQLFCPTVFDDVAFGPTQFGLTGAALQDVVTRALTKVRLSGFEQRSPHHLSLGEKRRVCLAGVLACDPKVLVLDEPTSDLDPRGKRELLDLLHHLPTTRIVASHDLDMVAALCSRVFVLDEGRLIASGNTHEVLANEALMLAHGLEKPHSLRHQHPH